jgi:mannose-6-phosphate isomerase
MWHILRAEPNARIAVGLNRTVSRDELESAAPSRAIEDMLQWVPVQPGENYFIPAGTIHAIGGGIALFEIQQKSDVTYRLYDWGRGRELHLQHALEVADLTPFDGKRDLPLQCEYFRTEPGCNIVTGPALLAVTDGAGMVDGHHLQAGDVLEVDGPVALPGNLKTLCIR